MDSDILIKPQLRPCLANGQKAFFHRWIKVAENIGSLNMWYPETYALVEFESGKCEPVSIFDIRFLDSGALFYEQGWPDDEEIPLF